MFSLHLVDYLKRLNNLFIGFPKLKTLVFTYCWNQTNYMAFDLIDNCPKLQSVHITNYGSGRIKINETIKNLSLQNLVIIFSGSEVS